jgi:hypothetical protein
LQQEVVVRCHLALYLSAKKKRTLHLSIGNLVLGAGASVGLSLADYVGGLPPRICFSFYRFSVLGVVIL